MTDREIVRYINNLLKERKISLESVANYYSANESSFKSPEDFFSQSDERDYSKFYAIADLLGEEPEKVKEYFNKELKERNINTTIAEPTDNDYLHILTSFVYFPAYFSLAWNWTSFIENRIGIGLNNIFIFRNTNVSKKSKPKQGLLSFFVNASTSKNTQKFNDEHIKELDIGSFKCKVAGSELFQDFGPRIKLEDFGYLGFRIQTQTDSLQLFFECEDSNKTLKIKVDFAIGDITYSANLKKDNDSNDRVYSIPINVSMTGEIEVIEIRIEG